MTGRAERIDLAPEGPEPWLKKGDLARRYSVSTRWIEFRIAKGMPCRKLGGGGHLLFQISKIDAWLEGQA